MKRIWYIIGDMYLKAYELAKKNGKKPGDNFEPEMLEVMKKYNKKPIGATELTKEEFIEEQLSHDKKVVRFKVDKSGNSVVEIIRKDKNNV